MAEEERNGFLFALVTKTMTASRICDLRTTCSYLLQRKDMVIDNIKVEILTRSESTKYLGQMITFTHQETTEIKNRIRTAWATFNKYKQELTSRLSPSSPTSIVRRSGLPDGELRLRNMGPPKRPRKNGSIDATQNASAHHSHEKKIQNKTQSKEEEKSD